MLDSNTSLLREELGVSSQLYISVPQVKCMVRVYLSLSYCIMGFFLST